VSGTYHVMLKITLTLTLTLILTLTLTYTRPPMFDRLQRRNNSHSVVLTAIRLLTRDYFSDPYGYTKFGANPSTGASKQMG